MLYMVLGAFAVSSFKMPKMLKMLWCPRYNIRGKRVLLSSAFRDLYIELRNHGLALVLSVNKDLVPKPATQKQYK